MFFNRSEHADEKRTFRAEMYGSIDFCKYTMRKLPKPVQSIVEKLLFLELTLLQYV